MKKSRSTLKEYFQKGKIPTESNFADLIDSMLNQEEDHVLKLPNDPLSIKAIGEDESLINFYSVKDEKNPTWQIKQNPDNKPGLSIHDASGSRFFIQSGTGNVGIGTTEPKAKLDVKGTISGKLWHSGEYVWTSGCNPTKMIDSQYCIAFLTYVWGNIATVVKVFIGEDGYWYLGGSQGAGGQGIMAKARCIGMQPPDYRTPDYRTPAPAPVQEGLILHLSGDTYIDGFLWTDISGKDNHAVIAPNCTMASLFEVKGYSGKDFRVMRFDKDGGMHLPDSLNVKQPFTIMIVDRYYGDEQKRTLQSRDPVNWLIGKWGGNNACHMGYDFVGPKNLRAEKNQFYINTAMLKDNAPAWYLDGELKGSTGVNVNAPGHLGFGKGDPYDERSEADIAAVLIWDRVLSDEERQKVEKWLAEQYGIELKTSS